MSCSNRNLKNCNAKSCQRYFNNVSTTFAADQTVQLPITGNRVVDSGLSIETNNSSYEIVRRGLYHISADIVANATTAGDLTLQILLDGVALPCTTTISTLAVGNNAIHAETDLLIDGCCCNVSRNVSFAVISGAAVGSVVHTCTGVLKLA